MGRIRQNSQLKGLIINHESDYINSFFPIFKELDIHIDIIHHSKFTEEKTKEYDFVILSGGPIHISNPFDLINEKLFLKKTKKPVLGVCLGHEIFGVTFGSKLHKFVNKRIGFHKIKFKDKEGELFYYHGYYIRKKPKGFKVLQKTKQVIEIMEHETKPFLSFQAHPEKSNKFGKEIINIFIEDFVKK